MMRRARCTAGAFVFAVAFITSTPLPSTAQELSMSVELPPGLSPGDRTTVTGTVGEACKPGTAEVGFSRQDGQAFTGMGTGDPRRGDEAVIYRPDVAPGNPYSADVVIPDPGVDTPVLYAICQQDAPFVTYFGSSRGYPLGAAAPIPTATSPGDRAAAVARRTPIAAIGVGAIVALAAAALALRSLRKRPSREQHADHTSCVARHGAVAAGTTSAIGGARDASRATASELARPVDALNADIEQAQRVFDGLLDPSSVAERLIDETLEQIAGLPR